jgi:hypothetical protein
MALTYRYSPSLALQKGSAVVAMLIVLGVSEQPVTVQG